GVAGGACARTDVLQRDRGAAEVQHLLLHVVLVRGRLREADLDDGGQVGGLIRGGADDGGISRVAVVRGGEGEGEVAGERDLLAVAVQHGEAADLRSVLVDVTEVCAELGDDVLALQGQVQADAALDGVARDDAEFIGIDPVRAVTAVAGGVDPLPGAARRLAADITAGEIASTGHDVHSKVSGGDGRVRDFGAVAPQCEGAAAHEQGRTGGAGNDPGGLLLHLSSPSWVAGSCFGSVGWCGPWGSLRAGCYVGGQCAVTGPEAVHSIDSSGSRSVRGQVMAPSVVPPRWSSSTAMSVSGGRAVLVTV